MIPLLVPEISSWAVFVTDEEEELGILVLGFDEKTVHDGCEPGYIHNERVL